MAYEETLSRLADGRKVRLMGRTDKKARHGMEFYAFVDCVCGSSLSSGEWWPSMRRAVDEARGNVEQHEAAHKCREKERP